MSDPYIIVTSEGGTLRSNEIDSDGVGMEVKAGLTGLGLPGVTLQFDEGSGDGAKYRGRRILQRNLDLVVQIYGSDRADFKVHLDRLALVLAHPCTVTWVDGEEAWSVTAYRSGGGDFALGEDGDGRTFIKTELTLTTDDPFWQSENVERFATESGPLIVDNNGTEPSAALWTIDGPTLGFTATSPTGEELRFDGLIDAETQLFIDTETGRVTDSLGVNRYGELAALPQFWKVPIGTSSLGVEFDQDSAEFLAAVETRTNYVLNPNLKTNAANYTFVTDRMSYDAANDRIVASALVIATNRPAVKFTAPDVPAGSFVVRLDVSLASNSLAGGRASYPHTVNVIGVRYGAASQLKQATFVDQARGEIVIEVDGHEGGDVTVEFWPHATWFQDGFGTRYWSINPGTALYTAYVGRSGIYFDGESTIPGYTAAWTGTSRASKSTLTLDPETLSNAKAEVEYRPRKWLVI